MRTRTSSISSSSRLSSANHRAVAGRMSSTKMISFPSFPVVAVLCGVLALSDFSVREADAHGRLIEPPSRSSAWRYNFPTAPNYNDHELYCGGFSRQWQKNGGKCGICGDAWDLPQPRPNEAGGRYGQGVIVRKLQKNGPIRIKVELTANHAGFFEFRLCPHNNPKKTASQRCLDKYVLQRMDGDGARYFPTPGRSEVFSMEYQLPKDVVCTQCILQWRYVAGNNWGMCKNGTGMLGCGPQEEFRACADIAILGEGEVTTFDDEDGEQDVHEPPKKDDEDYNEVDSDFNRGEIEAGDEEVFNPAERIAAIVCGFLLTSLLLAAAIGLSYVGKKRLKAFFSRWTPPSVASGLSATSAWFKKRFLFCGGRFGGTKKPPLPTTKNPGAAIYGTPAAAINAALERGEKPPMAPMRKHHGRVTNNGMVSATLVAPGLSFNPAAPTGSLKPTASPIQHPIYQPAPRPSEAPPPPPSRPPRQRSPKRQLSSGSTTGSNTADDSQLTPMPTPEDANITVNGVALPD